MRYINVGGDCDGDQLGVYLRIEDRPVGGGLLRPLDQTFNTTDAFECKCDSILRFNGDLVRDALASARRGQRLAILIDGEIRLELLLIPRLAYLGCTSHNPIPIRQSD